MAELTTDEKKLLDQYRVMNANGKDCMLEMAEFYMLRHPINIIPLSVLENARKTKTHATKRKKGKSHENNL